MNLEGSVRQHGEWTIRVYRDVNNWWKAICVRGEGKARQARTYTKLTAERAAILEPSWQ